MRSLKTYIGVQHVALVSIVLLCACHNCTFVVGSLNGRLTRSLWYLFLLRRCRRQGFLRSTLCFHRSWRGSWSCSSWCDTGSAYLCGPSLELSLQVGFDSHAKTFHGCADVGRQGLVFANGTLLWERSLT